MPRLQFKCEAIKMEKLMKLLQNYGRFLELEDNIPYWEAQRPELRERIRELKLNRDGKQIELGKLENPNFFHRLFGRLEDKKDKLAHQYREATVACTAAEWELKALEDKIGNGKQELEELRGSREAYEQAKRECQLTTIQESQLVMEELAAFTPAAIAAADRVLEALEDARFWMQEDALCKGVSPNNRKMEFLSKAEENARRLCEILSIMPEGVASVGSYLRNPDGYIDAVTSEYRKLDRLNNAVNQVQETRNQLSMLQ